MELKERIALARKQAGLSQEQLGEKLGVSRQAVSKWESGQNNPDVAYLAEMCRLFGVSSDWLLLGKETEQASIPARCPDCHAIVTGLNNFCPNCGQSLQDTPCTYTLVVTCGEYSPDQLAGELIALAGFHLLPSDSPITRKQSREEVASLLAANPSFALAHGLSKEQVNLILEKLSFFTLNAFQFYRDGVESKPKDWTAKKPIPITQLKIPDESLSFGGIVLAVIVGIICAILLLSIL